MSIWKLESQKQDMYAYLLSEKILAAMGSHMANERKAIRRLWGNEKWASIVKKFQTEGSVWYAWWMDGVNAFLVQQERPRRRKCANGHKEW
jgi:hypothetical protein